MQNLKVSIIQSEIIWEDISSNLNLFSAKLSNCAADCDLVILPEMFNTGFSMNTSKCAESMDGDTVTWMKEKANQYQTALVGSLIVKEGPKIFNRLLLAEPNGQIQQYDKKHLFSIGGEHKSFAAGTELPIFHFKGWRICPQICYDLRFPVWSRNTDKYDAIIYVASWPAIRTSHWDKLLQARSIENQCYVLAANRIGTDGNGVSHIGHSGVLDFMGDWQQKLLETDAIIQSELDFSKLQVWRRQFPVLGDADSFTIGS
jgi:omega-amidase